MKPKSRTLLLAAFLFVSLLCFTNIKAKAEELIRIDANKKYKGMNASFAKGYVPSIKKNTLYLTVPFLTDAKLKNDNLLVGVAFEREENSPFVFKNYQKQVRRSKKGVWLYTCKIKLKKDRINGQYPMRLEVLAKTQEEIIRQEFIIYIEIADGRAAVTNEEMNPPKDTPPESAPESPKEEISHQPRIIFTKNSLQTEELLAGETAIWELYAQNCSQKEAVENVKVTLLTESSDISFEKNSWYFAGIGAGETINLSQSISVLRKAAQSWVPVSVQFEYEDKKGEAYTSTENLRLFVRQTQQANLSGFFMPESFYESDTQSVAFQIQNTGFSMLYNAKVSLEGTGLFAKEVFLGNIEPGSSMDGEMQIFAGTLDMDEQGEISDENAKKYGDVFGQILFSYEDDAGVATVQKQEFSTAIKKPQVVELKIEEEKPQTNQWQITVTAMGFLVLILIIVWLWLRMKHYQRMGKEIYERT